MDYPKTKNSLMPWVVGIAVVVLVWIIWERRSKAATGNAAGGAPLIPTGNAPPSMPQAPPPVTGAATYDYTIQGNKDDTTPLGLARAWGQADSTSSLDDLLAANDSLHKVWQIQTAFVSDTDGEMSSTRQFVFSDTPSLGDFPVNPSTTPGQKYGQSPQPGATGTWRSTGVTVPGVGPWQVGQTIHIPPSWGAPPSRSLEQFSSSVPAA